MLTSSRHNFTAISLLMALSSRSAFVRHLALLRRGTASARSSFCSASISRPPLGIASHVVVPNTRAVPHTATRTLTMNGGADATPADLSPTAAHIRLTAPPASATPAVYLDVRQPGEFEAGHVPDAINIPVTAAGGVAVPNFVEDVLASVSADVHVIVGCKSGRRSTFAISLLKEAKFPETRLSELTGGFDAWLSDQSLPVEK